MLVRAFKNSRKYSRGYSVMDIIMTVGVMTIVISLTVPAGMSLLNQVKSNTVMDELAILAEAVIAYCDQQGCPDELAEVFGEEKIDPWGNPYRYLKIAGGHPSAKGKARKYKSKKQINTRFDLYSMGPDGESVSPLTASSSKDDVIYADDGKFIGYVDEYID